jgi:hypothetical protein
MFATEYENKIFKIPKPGNTISQCIQDISHDAKSQMIANIKELIFLPSSWIRQLTSLEKLNS